MLIIPPALDFIAVALLAHLHGRMGYFPDCVRLRPVEGARPPRFEVAEIIELNHSAKAAEANEPLNGRISFSLSPAERQPKVRPTKGQTTLQAGP